MRIRTIRAGNFKSLLDFRLELAKFTCLIGLNGSGKSTVLQFIDFIAGQMRGDIRGWLEERHRRPRELVSRLTSRKNIDFSIAIVTDQGEDVVSWNARFNTTLLQCSSERIVTPGAILEVRDGNLSIVDLTRPESKDQVVLDERIAFSYEGSVLSQLKRETLPVSLRGFKDYFSGIRSLDLLSPDDLRAQTRESSDTVGLGGKRLAAFLHEIGPSKRKKLTDTLRQVYNQLDDLESRSLQSGLKRLEIREKYDGSKLITEARHINDGMLRLIAILAELQSDHRFVLFDEIENGINPEMVEFAVNKLVEARQQVLVTTHSPVILNYLSDDVAREGVIYLYKTTGGSTQAIPFFSIPSLAKKLKVMGPGEAFVDTNLTLLRDEIEQMTEGR
jgi:ABC-type branched-subunit amino acid transport system ATPase component